MRRPYWPRTDSRIGPYDGQTEAAILDAYAAAAAEGASEDRRVGRAVAAVCRRQIDHDPPRAKALVENVLRERRRQRGSRGVA